MKNTIKTLKRITASFLRFISFGNIDLDRARHQPWGRDIDPARAGANASRAIEKIKGATHPDFRDRDGRSQHLHRGDFQINGQWVREIGQARDVGYGGWYIRRNRECWTVCNPNNPADYNDRTQRHETAHDLEAQLADAGDPDVVLWHWYAWRHLFTNWRNTSHGAIFVPELLLPESRSRLAWAARDLPHVEYGDDITLDIISTHQQDHHVTVACRAGMPDTVIIT